MRTPRLAGLRVQWARSVAEPDLVVAESPAWKEARVEPREKLREKSQKGNLREKSQKGNFTLCSPLPSPGNRVRSGLGRRLEPGLAGSLTSVE